MDNQAAEYVLRLSTLSAQALKTLALKVKLPSKAMDMSKQAIHHQRTTGKQNIAELQKGFTEHVDISKTDLRALGKELKKYHVDFSIRRDKETGMYHVFSRVLM